MNKEVLKELGRVQRWTVAVGLRCEMQAARQRTKCYRADLNNVKSFTLRFVLYVVPHVRIANRIIGKLSPFLTIYDKV